MTIPNYASDEFAQMVGNKTFCGPNAWKRLMTWLEVDESFKLFMKDWLEYIAPTYHSEIKDKNLPNISGLLEEHFENLYPAFFILRLVQIADINRQKWIFTSLSEKQQQILYEWIHDSELDAEKGRITDHWLDGINPELVSYNGTPIFSSVKSEIFTALSIISNQTKKRLR
ncbi:hypothetical protein [Marinospirillum alkaliphilum]|uniref:Uncharacterized protein n=1 Tax=Marinospirillum alkaliphilum DSM 21637 TaxID=1122209 RepID=A0A1K1VIC7_9GAMM|nr:hypothetical protein [Marinospirillum alkaliphilum]SFX24929.1 hypothetical protein SAMN02745752_01007 [Marinospirillum alkaliphilum DSM 21637]